MGHGRRNGHRDTEGCCNAPISTATYTDDRGYSTPAPRNPCRCCLSSHLLQHMRIAIVGTGLAGLSTAISLEQVGYRHITLYERDSYWNERKEGYGLTLTYDPRGALEALGVLDEIANEDCPSRSHYLFDPLGNVKGYFGNAFFNLQSMQDSSQSRTQQQRRRGVGQRGNLRVPRQTVRKVLLNRLQYSKIEWDHKLLDVVQCEGDQLELVFDRKQEPEKEVNVDPTSSSPDNGDVQKITTRYRVKFDLVIAADGIRSNVVKSWIPRAPPPTSLHVRIILGLSKGYVHPLLDERGFYSLSPGTRLFVMPFAGNQLDAVEERRFMWQLSFASKKGHESDEQNYSPEQLLEQAMTICRNWHTPIPQMMAATPISTVWGTMLYDRDPLLVYRAMKEMALQRVLVVGDALHAMSPFKGQGANQALQDGRAVAQWLDPHSTRKQKTRRLDKAVKSCLRELVQRTQGVVHASREASRFWHSKQKNGAAMASSLEGTLDKESLELYHQHFKFAGVPQDHVPALTQLLQERQVRGGSCDDLDQSITQVLLESGLCTGQQTEVLDDRPEQKRNNEDSADNSNGIQCRDPPMDMAWTERVCEAARSGELGQLRRLSWEGQQCGCLIANIRNDQEGGNTPLHLAVQTQQDQSFIAWLVREAGCDLQAVNQVGQTPMGLAMEIDKAPKQIQLLERLAELL